MTVREKLIRIIETAPPELIELLVELMIKREVNPKSLTKPHTVRQ